MTSGSLHEQIAAARAAAHGLAAGLSEARFNWRPAPGRWSVGDCLAHLNLTGAGYLAAMDRALDSTASSSEAGREPLRPGWLGRLLARQMEPPVKRGMPAPRTIRPPERHDPEPTTQRFVEVQDAFAARLARAESSGADPRVTSPISPLLRLRLSDCLAFLLAHQRRHLWQARRVREDPGLPA